MEVSIYVGNSRLYDGPSLQILTKLRRQLDLLLLLQY